MFTSKPVVRPPVETVCAPNRVCLRDAQLTFIRTLAYKDDDMGKRKIVSESDVLEEVVTPGPGDVYGVVVKMYGYDRALVECSDGKQRLCRIKGQLKRRIWIKEGDLVLVSPWEFQQDRGDIFWRFTKNQAIELAKQGALPDFLKAKIEAG